MKKTLSILLSLLMAFSAFSVMPLFASAAETTVTCVVSELGYKDTEEVSGFDLDGNISAVTSQNNGHYSSPKYFSSDGSLRIHEFNTITFSAATGYVITGMEITFVNSIHNNLDYDGENGVFEAEDAIGVWSGTDKEIVFIGTSSNNAHIHTVKVTYTAAQQCGDNVYYSFSDDGNTVNIFGTGDTWDYTLDSYGNCNSPFYKNRDIKNIIVESGITGLGNHLFNCCFDVESISLPEGLTKIGECAFIFFNKAESVTLPSSVRHIGARAFTNWQKLKSITIPDGVTSIESKTFASCFSLKSVVIPKSVTSVGEDAFMACTSLTDVYYCGSEADRSNMTISSTNNERLTDATWHYNCQSGKCGDNVFYLFDGETLTLSGTGDTWDYIIDEYASPICDSPFYKNRDIKNIIVESGITGLGDYLFFCCYDVESISLPEGLTKIGEAAFSFFNKIDSITIPSSVTSIGAGAFANWQKLKSITIPDGVTSIESNAFFQCYDLESVVIPKSVMSIGDNAFENCSSLTDVYYYGSEADRSNMTISSTNNSRFTGAAWYYESGQCGDNVYYGCTYGSDLGENYKNLFINGTGDMYSWDNADNKSPFNGDIFINRLTIGSGVTNIGDYAFTGCTALLCAAIPKSVNAIGEGAFASSRVNVIVIPDGVETLEENVFSGCTNLNQLYIPSSVTAIKKGAFKDAPLSKEVFLGASGDDWSAVTTDETDNETLLNAKKYFGIPGAFEGFKEADIEAINYQENEIKDILVLLPNDHKDKKITLTVFNDKGETVCSEEATVTAYLSNFNFSTAEWTPPYLKSGEYTVFAYGVLDGYKDNTEKDGKQYLYYNTESFEVTPKPKFSISNYAELKEFATLVNGGLNTLDAVLTADIVADDADWKPIGNDGTQYIGTFDGDGHTITGLSNEDVNDKPLYAGLFGYVGDNGVVTDVGLESGSINGNVDVGRIAGFNYGNIKNCRSSGVITVDGMVYTNYGNIENCRSSIEISDGTPSYSGGIARANYGSIKNCRFNGCFKSGGNPTVYSCGGIVAENYGTISYCRNEGEINIASGQNPYLGGIAAQNRGTVEFCCFTGSIIVSDCYPRSFGGIVGENGEKGKIGSAHVKYCYNKGVMRGHVEAMGGIVYTNAGGCIVENCYSAGTADPGNDNIMYLGGIAAANQGTVRNCYFDSNFCSTRGTYYDTEKTYDGAFGDEPGGTVENVGPLTTAQMTGAQALNNLVFDDSSLWLVKADMEENGKITVFYPQLKGFDFKDGVQQTGEEILPENWIAKTEISAGWKDTEFTYDSKGHNPNATLYIGDCSVPEGLTAEYYWIERSMSTETPMSTIANKSAPLLYRMDLKDGDTVVGAKYFFAHPKHALSLWRKTGTDETTQEPVYSTDPVSAVDAGEYKATLSFGENRTEFEKAFKINPKAVTITAGNSTKVYDGTPLTNGSFTHSALETGDTHTFTVVMTQGSTITDAGSVDNVIATVDGVSVTPGTATPVGNYTVTAANGTLEIIQATAAVTISGHNNISVFDGGEHSVSGYDFASTNPLYMESYFTFIGNALAKRTDFGTTNMGLLDSQFLNTNNNFSVTFIVTDGYQQIVPKQINDSFDVTLDSTVYDGAAKQLAVKSGDKVLAAGADYSVSIKNAEDAAVSEIIGAGEYTVTVTGKGNYTGSVTKTVTVAPAKITVTAEDKESNHGTDLLPLTYKIGGNYVDGDSLGISLNADIDNTKPGAYTITPSWNNNSNYTATLVDGTYTVGDDPHYYGTQGDERFTCTVCGAVDDTLKAEAEAADKDVADTAAANAVTDMINALPEKEEITTADEAAIKKAREAYDSLTDDQKAKVTQETVKKLTEAEKALAEEKAEEATAAKEKAKAEFVAGVDGTSTDSSITVKWGKVNGAKRYVIYAAYCDKNHKYKYKKIKTVSGKVTKYEIKKLYGKKLNPKKNVKVYIVAQKKKNGKWRKIFKTPTFHIAGAKSKFSNVKKITVKKAKYSLAVGKTAKIKAEIVLVDKNKKAVNHVRKLRFRSTNTAVVKVTKSGKIKAVGKGTATVFVYSNNGTAKAIKVTVK